MYRQPIFFIRADLFIFADSHVIFFPETNDKKLFVFSVGTPERILGLDCPNKVALSFNCD